METLRSWISFLLLLTVKIFARTFYRFRIGWPPKGQEIQWDKVRLIVFLNHTSLYEFLFAGFLPLSFLRRLSRRMVAPGADKTLQRPIVGIFFKLFNPGIISITRKKDWTWHNFLSKIHDDSVILIVPEGRMKRRNGLDLEGKKMTVRSGILDILKGLDKGQMVFAYSGGLHHVQIPDHHWWPNVCKTIRMNLETMDIADYKAMFPATEGSEDWKKLVLQDLQYRLENKIPK